MQKITSILLTGFVFAIVGCHTAQVKNPLPPAVYAANPDAQMDFWHDLATRKLASNNEAFHGLLLYFDGKDSAENYQQRVQVLKSRKLLPAKFHEPENAAVTRGTL